MPRSGFRITSTFVPLWDPLDLYIEGSLTEISSSGFSTGLKMGGGSADHFLEGSVLGASFWRWWNRAWTGEPDAESDHSAAAQLLPQRAKVRVPVSPVAASEELVLITAVVPRPRPPPPPPPPPPPRKSKPIDIPTRKPVSIPVFDSVPEDKRYWYQ